MSVVSDFLAPRSGGAKTAPTYGRELFASAGRRTARFLEIVGFGWVVTLALLVVGSDRKRNAKELWKQLGIPLVAIAIFLGAWASLAPRVHTSLGGLPGPQQVWHQAGILWSDHLAERAKQRAFFERLEIRNAQILAGDPTAQLKVRPYTGKPTFIDQIFTSLETVFTGFVFATLVAIPLGILCGLFVSFNSALNPLVQILKPVSPLAWLPIVTMLVSALYVSDDPLFPKSFLISAITVTMCSLWPTLINSAVGVASIDKDLLNVSRVLRLSWPQKIARLVIPSSLPYIFTGLRLSLGVGWMVLIAAEMLAQNPGLGKFVWDEFQNGSSDSLARIMVAIVTIGIIGFILDRLMLAIQTAVTHDARR